MNDVLQHSTRGFNVYMVDTADNVTGLAGLTLICTRSKNGAAFGSVSPTITDRGDGWYFVMPLAADRDTLGEVAWNITATGAVTFPRIENVVAYDSHEVAVGASTHDVADLQAVADDFKADVSNLDVAVSSRSSHGAPDLSNLDAAVSSRQPVGNVSVDSFTPAALLQLVEDDTGLTMAEDGSVARISQGSAADITAELQTIIAQTSLISSARIEIVSPVTLGGKVIIYRGSDYRVRSSTAIPISAPDAGGVLHAQLTDPEQVESIIFGAGSGNAANCVVGSIARADVSYADNVTKLLVEITSDQINAKAGDTTYHIKAIAPIVGGESKGDEVVKIDGECEVRNERAKP